MKKFYLAGHNNFGNRGCEALVRSTVQMLTGKFGASEFLVPSFNPVADARQWPKHQDFGVRFVDVPVFPANIKVWGRAARAVPAVKRVWKPRFRVPSAYRRMVLDCDATIMIGGDVITLDYGIGPLVWHRAFAEDFLGEKQPTMLWAASVGPFSKEPEIEPHMATFLNRLDLVTVRESITAKYLAGIGVSANVQSVCDPAFVMQPEPVDASQIGFDIGSGFLGLNVSPLIAKFRQPGEDPAVLQREVAEFIRQAQRKYGMRCVLIPHVGPLDTGVESDNDDHRYMQQIKALVPDVEGVQLLPNHLNAAQLKYVLGQARFFIGARTHATIGAISRGTPTVSIAYSTKARGLNRDLFGHEDYVLSTPDVSSKTLLEHLDLLVNREAAIRAQLAEVVPRTAQRSLRSADLLAERLGRAA
jgi:polysaccharide pyruvyl transferase WcaK-like protein